MKNKILKGKTPSLIGASNGRPKQVNVQRKSECCRCGEGILMGTVCFNIPKSGSGFSKEQRYCRYCYEKVLEQTQRDLDKLRAELLVLESS